MRFLELMSSLEVRSAAACDTTTVGIVMLWTRVLDGVLPVDDLPLAVLLATSFCQVKTRLPSGRSDIVVRDMLSSSSR